MDDKPPPSRRSRRYRGPMHFIRQTGYPKTRLYNDLAAGRIPHLRCGKTILIAEDDFETYLARFAQGERQVAA